MRIKRAISAAALAASLLAIAAPARLGVRRGEHGGLHDAGALEAAGRRSATARSYFLAPGGDFEAGAAGLEAARAARRTTTGAGVLGLGGERRAT